jgi:hypothetical protein
MTRRTWGILRCSFLGVLCMVGIASWSQSSTELPKVELIAKDLQPRSIEELTHKSITRDYAYAWKTLAVALDQNRPELLDSYFTGFAKNNFSQLISDQKQTGVRVHYIDHGHKLNAVFYSPAGDAMQLRDQADIEIEILDGDKTVHREQGTVHYLVLMTPGADRWLVRDLQTVGGPRP